MKESFYKTGRNMVFLWKQMSQADRHYHWWVVLQACSAALLSWLGILMPRYVMDFVLLGKEKAALAYVAGYAALSIVLLLGEQYMGMKSGIAESLAEDRLRLALARKQMELPYYYVEGTHRRYDLARKAVENGSIRGVLGRLAPIVSGVWEMAGVLFVFSHLDVWVVLLLVIVILVNAVGNKKRLEYHYERDREGIQIEQRLYYARDYLTSPAFAKEVRVFGLAGYVLSKIREGILDYFELERRTSKEYYRRFWWTYAVNGLQMAAVYAYIGWLVQHGSLTAGEFTMYVFAALLFSSSAVRIITSFAEISNTSEYIEGLRQFLCQEGWGEKGDCAMEPCPDDDAYLVFDRVSFRYGEDSPFVLKDVSFRIRRLEKLCIVGENGSGKTTLVKLLLRLYEPTEGRILMNGRDIAEYGYREYINAFSAVFQDFQLFAFRASENITLGRQVQKERLSNVLRQVGLDQRLGEADAYLTGRLAEDGDVSGVSGGEGQLLAIARAIYKDAPICILDEPTAALSPSREYEVYRLFGEMAEGRTVVFISHRLAICRLTDRILVLGNGGILECGTHEELVEKGGEYARMFAAQSEYYKQKCRDGTLN